MVLVMNNKFDSEIVLESRVDGVNGRHDDVNFHVSGHNFEMSLESRVSTDGVNGKDDVNFNEIRGFSGHDLVGAQMNEIDDGREFPESRLEMDDCRVYLNGDSGDLVETESSSRDDDDDDDDSDSDSDNVIEFMVLERENGVATPEVGIDRIVGGNDDLIGEREKMGSAGDFGVVHYETNSTAVCNNEAVRMDGIDGDFRLKRSNDLQVSISRNVSASEGHDATKDESAKFLCSRFEIGEMVWAKVKSHPWWPGHIYNEAFASSSVRRSRRDGHVLAAFFGDSSYGWFEATELIPYELHFADKSQQMHSKGFVKAVEESIEETSKRSALGLSCRCRNLYNFRPTSVPGYLAVDVVDYDPGAIYSVSQIQKAREGFHPAEALVFLKQLAVAPRSSNSKSLDYIKHKATALAYRRSIFEEFDETYAEAFGEQPVRPSQLPPELIDKQRSQAALSGPLVFAEARGGRKSSAKATKSKEPSKKDRYLFKRRDEAGIRTTHISQAHAGSSSSSAYEDGTPDSAAADYVFQKKDHSLLINDEMAVTPAKNAPVSGLDAAVSMDVFVERLPIDSTSGLLQSESNEVVATKLTEELVQIRESDQMKTNKKKKAAKRSAEEENLEKSDPSEKKKRRNVELEVSHVKNETQVTNYFPQQIGSVPLDEADVELPQMLSDLCGLASNPFHGAERNRPAILRQFFLKFRSLKNSGIPMAESPETNSKSVPPLLKASKLSARQEDPTKGGRKRVPPERQEELASKRPKKISEAKSLGGVKKRGDRPPRVEEPTYLMMKFQSGSSLPSLVELKARFARFGPLDTSLIRVFYKTNSCRVAFFYKEDAHMAYEYAVGSKSVFSNVKFMLKPVDPPETQQPVIIPLPGDLLSNREAPRPLGPLKSCLKKSLAGGPTKAKRVRFNLAGESGGVGGASSNSSSSRGGVQGQQMVESRNGLKSSLTEGCPLSLSSSVGMDVISSKNQRFIISSHPMQLSPHQFIRPPKEVALRSNFNNYNVTCTSGPPSPENKDISQQMMSLLTRCHDVVANVKSVLGYVPYHP